MADSPPTTPADRSPGIGCLVIAAMMILAVLLNSNDSQVGAGGIGAENPPLSDEAVKSCRELLAKATSEKVIRHRPQPYRINVDEIRWAALDAYTKDRIMQAVACDVWGRSMPPPSEYVVAYGYHSGRRLWMLTSVGMDRGG